MARIWTRGMVMLTRMDRRRAWSSSAETSLDDVIRTLMEGNRLLKEVTDEVKKGNDEVKKGNRWLKEVTDDVKKGNDRLLKGMLDLTDEVKKGNDEVKKGNDRLLKGILELNQEFKGFVGHTSITNEE